MIVCGIDYSMTSPAICVHRGVDWSFNNCKFYYFAKKERNILNDNQLFGRLYPRWETPIERFSNLADWSLEILTANEVQSVFIEGYSYGSSSSSLFQIAENTSLLKYSLWKKGVPFEVYAPTEIKKYATGKGNANKEKLYDAFFSETSLDLRKKLNIMNVNDWNPVSDIVDSYYIAKLGFMKEKQGANHA